MNCYVRVLLFLITIIHPYAIHSDSIHPIINFIIGVDGESVIVNKKINRDGLPTYRAYSFSTIQAPGYYRLAGNVANAITIAASNVQLNLGGNTVTGGITVNNDLKNITINNGIVVAGPSNAITINSGCSSIKIVDVSTQNAGTAGGILMTQVFDSVIRNCEMVQSTTGITLNQCSNIAVQNCSAIRNRFAGFSLITSNTCVFATCKAISTGDGNTNTANNSIYGFVSQNGVGNIFNACIANSTQALSTTDYSSIIAGIALLGTERKTQIIGSSIANAMSSGVTVPHGIYLQATLGSQITLTAVPAVPTPAADVLTNDWSPDGQYLAVGTSETPRRVRVYSVDRLTNTLMQVATPNILPSTQVQAVKWSPDGLFIAAGSFNAGATDSKFRVYQFDRVNNSLRVFALPDVIPNGVARISWSPDMRYIACGSSNSPTIMIYRFDPIAATLRRVVTNTDTAAVSVLDLSWSPDGAYLAVGAAVRAQPLLIYAFDRSQQQLFLALAFAPNGTIATRGVAWSPDGKYLAIVMGSTDTPKLRIYSFNRSTNQLTLLTTAATLGLAGNGQSVAWSGDGRYVVVTFSSAPVLSVFSFDRGTNQLVSAATPNIAPPVQVNWANWSPDGRFISATMNNTAITVAIYTALTFPTDNIIKNNTVYCDSGGSNSGVGILGSSIGNMIVQNTSYSNPINPPIVSSNYQFACNVFNPLFQDSPTLLQNLALGSCDPIPVRPDAVQNFEILLSKLTDIATKVDLITLT